jgi:hypothetical protein
VLRDESCRCLCAVFVRRFNESSNNLNLSSVDSKSNLNWSSFFLW